MSSIEYGRAVAAATGRGFKSHQPQPDNLRREADSDVCDRERLFTAPVLDTSMATPC